MSTLEKAMIEVRNNIVPTAILYPMGDRLIHFVFKYHPEYFKLYPPGSEDHTTIRKWDKSSLTRKICSCCGITLTLNGIMFNSTLDTYANTFNFKPKVFRKDFNKDTRLLFLQQYETRDYMSIFCKENNDFVLLSKLNDKVQEEIKEKLVEGTDYKKYEVYISKDSEAEAPFEETEEDFSISDVETPFEENFQYNILTNSDLESSDVE